jgi:tRNA pseudouridine38-40 synthase
LPTWKLTIEYDGSRYSGWQEQKNASRTVMGELRKAAQKALGGRVELQGAGRTDAGVHAAAQVAHLRARKGIPAAALETRLNDALPYDIAILSVEEAPEDFHARHDAVSRTYVYQISRRKTAFSKRFVWWVKEPLNVKAMADAAKAIEGRHDFVTFRAADPEKEEESTVVVVEAAQVEEKQDEGLILIRITASHYLWRMVRRLVGALVRVGRGELSTADFERLVEGHARPDLAVAEWTAPASGLFLESVRYSARKKR